MAKGGIMRFDIVTLFPEIVASYAGNGMVGQAQKKGLLQISAVDLRQFGHGKHKQVDDRPFGGGAGMVLMFEPIKAALDSIHQKLEREGIERSQTRVIATTAGGKTWKQSIAKEFAAEISQKKTIKSVIILAGRYEGFDQRILDELVDEQYSLGNFVLTGGELPALAMVDSISRLLPGVLGKEESYQHDSFYRDDKTTQYPRYTRPETIEYDDKTLSVPEILLSGNHAKIREWEQKNEGLFGG
ncbi:MAG: tRNA (guanosine(37)-N1)-methyltransferase TrmD [Candidatus Dojkabacteria bacterium]